MEIKILLSIFLFIIFSAESAYYEIIFERIESVPDKSGNNVIDMGSIRVKKFNRTTYVMNGKGSLKKPLGLDSFINMTVFALESGEYQTTFSKMFGFCEFKSLSGHKEIMEDFEAHTTEPIPWDACPYPAMDKEVVNYALKEEHFDFIPPGLPGEQWRINFLFNEKGVNLGGFNVYLTLRKYKSAYYDITFDRIETVPGEDGLIVFDAGTVRVKKFNRTAYVINGNGSLHKPLGYDVNVNMTGFYFEAGEYKIYSSKTTSFCEFKILPGHKEVLEDFEAHTTNPVPWDACPYPAMDKQIINYALKKEHFNFIPPGLPGEQWRFNFRFSQNGTDFGGFNIYLILTKYKVFA
ncbi:CLUMA_CG016218, isoform A [Clunio marinus]|uniref:CLUMA_CG016218, isoform A n=1 Tax=Clunio marinus TaxID=568069 RepID=A0A1J1IS54_9DIPT|nr:CLUMA_CG016218, isoform A [Clunio marinus]